jgi:hypothetical protein
MPVCLRFISIELPFPLVMVSFADFHFAALVLSLVDVSFVGFGDCYRLIPKACSSVCLVF